MSARPNSDEEHQPEELQASSRVERRTELRYHLAQLLTLEKFEEALNEALVARSKDEIFQCDLQFVVEIVKAAERMGRLKIDLSNLDESLLRPARLTPTLPAHQQTSSP